MARRKTRSTPLPNLYILGAEKCGTSALYALLDSHPDICMARPKEPVFYECRYELGAEYYSRTYFSHYRNESVVGEARHRNLYLPYIPDRILATTPDARFIILLRMPDERAYSAWLNRLARGYETLDFSQAVEADLERINSGIVFEGPDGPAMWCRGQDPVKDSGGLLLTSREYRTYVDVGYYNIQLRRYFDRFLRQNFLIIDADDMLRDPHCIVDNVMSFLGLKNPGTLPPLSRKNITRTKPSVRKSLSRLRHHGLWRRTFCSQRDLDYKTVVDPETRLFLKKHYMPHIEDLETLCDWPLGHWK